MIRRALLTAMASIGWAAVATAQSPPVKMIIATGVDPSLSTFYIAKTAGIFARNGLDVQLNTGPSGSAMVPFLVQNQVQAALAAEQAGLVTFNVDDNVVVAAQTMTSGSLFGLVGRNVADLGALKGKKVGVAVGSASEVFWRALITKLSLNAGDYKVVPVEPPEMVAAMERGDIDAIAAYEPWVSRTVRAVSNTKVLRDNEGIISSRDFVYLNRGWAEQNKDAAVRFMKSLAEAHDFMKSNPAEAARQISAFLKMELPLTIDLLGKVTFDLKLDDDSVDYLKTVEKQLLDAGRLKKPVDFSRFIYADVARKAIPDKVKLSH